MKCMILAGNDKLGRKLMSLVNDNKTVKVFDKSLSAKRVLSLYKKGRMHLSLLIKLALSELHRQNTAAVEALSVRSNTELLQLINEKEIDAVFMFRVGLIITTRVIDSRAKVINFHCARLPDYGGLGAVDRALKKKDINQEATMYYITSKIDDGQTIATEPYLLEPSFSYETNENKAYEAGIKLIIKQLEIWNEK